MKKHHDAACKAEWQFSQILTIDVCKLSIRPGIAWREYCSNTSIGRAVLGQQWDICGQILLELMLKKEEIEENRTHRRIPTHLILHLFKCILIIKRTYSRQS